VILQTLQNIHLVRYYMKNVRLLVTITEWKNFLRSDLPTKQIQCKRARFRHSPFNSFGTCLYTSNKRPIPTKETKAIGRGLNINLLHYLHEADLWSAALHSFTMSNMVYQWHELTVPHHIIHYILSNSYPQ